MDVDLGKGLIGGAFGFGSSLFNGFLSSRLQKQRQQFELDMWNRQNEYNKPVNQRSRLVEAGLNPALMYSNGGVQNVAQDMPRSVDDAFISSGAFAQNAQATLANMIPYFKLKSDIDNTDASTNKMQEEAATEEFKRMHLESQTRLNDVVARLDEQKILTEEQQTRISAIVAAFKELTIDTDIAIRKRELDKVNAELGLLEARRKEVESQTDLNDARRQEILETLDDTIAVLQSTKKLYDSQTMLTGQQFSTEEQMTALYRAQAVISNMDVRAVEDLEASGAVFPQIDLETGDVDYENKVTFREFMQALALARLVGEDININRVINKLDGLTGWQKAQIVESFAKDAAQISIGVAGTIFGLKGLKGGKIVGKGINPAPNARFRGPDGRFVKSK